MSETRAEMVERIWHEALARQGSARAAYLDQACAADAALRAEVEELLAYASRAETFIDTPAIDVIARGPHEADLRPFHDGDLVAGRFRIVRAIAEGGMGIVYEVVDEKLGERRALKCAKPGYGAHLPPEARASLRVTHPHVCRVFEIHNTASALGPIDVLTMEYVDGGTLAAVLRERGALPEAEARVIALQICAGVQAAHAQNLLHRDLKTSNVLLTKDAAGRVRAVVTDFGLAKEPVDGPPPEWATMAGTPAYLAPERWRGKPATVASDIYALGVVLHELITGGQPAMTPERDKILSPSLPPRWRRVIARCLEPDPVRRYASVADVATALVDRVGTVRRVAGWTAAALVPIAYVVWQVVFPPPIAARLAIVPLEAGDGSVQTAALLDGVSADLTSQLVRRRPRPPQMVVIPVDEGAGVDGSDPATAKNRLGASHLLRGVVVTQDRQLIVRAEIVDTTTLVAMREWAAQYPANDAGAIASGLSGFVAAAFKLPRQTEAEQVSPAAYPAYSEGNAALRRGGSGAAAAIAAFERAVAIDPRSVLPQAGLAEACYVAWVNSGDEKFLERGRTALAAAQRLNPDSLAVRLAAGRLNLVPGAYERAAQEYQRATELEPTSSEAWRGLGRAYTELPGRDADAASAFAKAIELQPGYYAPLVELGAFHFRRGNDTEAERQWLLAVGVAPDQAATHISLGTLYARGARYTDAERELRRSIQIDPENRPAINNLGALYLLLGRDTDAIPLLERARAIGPETPELMQNLGDAYRRRRSTVDSARAYRRGYELAGALLVRNPTNAATRARFAYFAARIGDRAAAERELVQAFNARASDVSVIQLEVLAYEALGERERTIAVLVSAPAALLRTLARHPDLRELSADPQFLAMASNVSK